MNSQDFSELLQSRHTVRDFKSDPIPESTMAAILEDARDCASWSNTRAYAIAIAQGERLKRISADYVQAFDKSLGLQRKDPSAILKAPFNSSLPDGDFRAWAPYPKDLLPRSQKVGKALYQHMGIARGDRAARDESNRNNLRFFGAPAVIWVFVHKGLLPFSAMDAGIMLQTVMLSAKAHGIDTCPLGVLSIWKHPVAKEFRIPKEYKLITGLALGYASDASVNDFRADHPPLEMIPDRG